jgi:UDP-GlcNAc:undecaprenyl-phosphate/decaprenyl-phosphate GlcNAc-1-phosphate transferase
LPGSEPHKIHKKPTVIAGGMVIYAIFVIAYFFCGLWQQVELRWSIFAVSIIFSFGLWDDIKNISARKKFIGQILSVLILLVSGIHVQFLQTSAFYLGGPHWIYIILDWIITILWIVGVTNSFNLIDSYDGLAIGLGVWASFFLLLATINSNQFFLSMLCAFFIGCCLSLYYFNMSPARLFLGDSGAQTLGLIFAVIGIEYNPINSSQISTWFVPILFLGIPLFDTGLVTFSRWRRKQAFYSANTDHLYHRLVSWGFEPGRSVIILHFSAVVLSCLALIAVNFAPLIANLIFLSCLLMSIVIFFILDNPKRWF